jgi:nitrogen fixation NifU-like protein
VSGAESLYRATVMDHARAPRRAVLPPGVPVVSGTNAACGDRLALGIRVDGAGIVTDYGFQAEGCALLVAAASLLGEALVGRPLAEARGLTAAVLGGDYAGLAADPGLAALIPAFANGGRRSCVELPFRLLLEAPGPPHLARGADAPITEP